MADAGALGLITTALVLGVRHGFDWDHLAAITDVTSTTATADAAELDHEAVHEHSAEHDLEHHHEHGGHEEREAHEQPLPGDVQPHAHEEPAAPRRFVGEQRRALLLGSMYALGHATVVLLLGALALAFGAVLPSWVDDVMGPVVGATLLFLGVWVFVSLYQYARHGREFRLRSRWMIVFDSIRFAWRRFQARLHGHEHVDPMEMSSYGVRTAYGVGMIHGIGAETGTQVLLIAAIGGASSQGLGFPMLFAFIIGLLISNSIVVFITATGFIASRFRQRLYVVIGVVAGAFSLVVGAIFLLGLEDKLPSIQALAVRRRLVSGNRSGPLASRATADRWAEVRQGLRSRGLRWTPQRRVVLEVLAGFDGHVTGADLVDGCRALDPTTTPSTVYRTLDVLEELGVVSHSHGREGRQEFHVNPAADHGHLVCSSCGRSWELDPAEAAPIVHGLRATRGFEIDVAHLSIEGRCADCSRRAG